MSKKNSSANYKAQEHKTFPAFITKVDSELGIVDAIVSVFGVVDLGNDRILPGAFRKTIVERAGRIRVLDQHNTDSILRVLGKPIEIREVGRNELPESVLAEFPEATGGLLTRTQFLLNTPEGRGAFDRISAGAVAEYSIGYDPLDVTYSEIEKDGKKIRVRDLRTIRLWEYSPVIWGMNPATATLDAKSDATGEDKIQSTVEVQDAADTLKAPGPKELDELTPDGPIQRLGDYLHACLLQSGDHALNCMYKEGMLNYDEYSTLSNSIRAFLSQFREQMPEDIALIPLSMGFYYGMLSLPVTPELKSGRVLSSANLSKLRQCIEMLNALIEEAGYGDEEEEKQASSPDNDLAGSEKPPTISKVDELKIRAEKLTRRMSVMENLQ